MYVSEKTAIELDVNQDAADQTVVSDIASTEHGISVKDLTLLDESPGWAQGLLLVTKAKKTPDWKLNFLKQEGIRQFNKNSFQLVYNNWYGFLGQ